MIDYFFYNECDKCDTYDEASFHQSGPHIKLVCSGCNSYIKFISPKKTPTLLQIKQKIYDLLNNDKLKVEIMKYFIEFQKYPEGSEKELKEYWRLYLHSRSKSI